MSKTILIVEDDSMSRTLVRDLLKMSGFKTIEATDGKQGVEMAKSARPDLILMDVMMPKMDGYTACQTIKADQSTRRIPVIMVTAVGYELNKMLASKWGADEYVTKPVDRQKLMNAISRFL